jgi:hypothetical protein
MTYSAHFANGLYRVTSRRFAEYVLASSLNASVSSSFHAAIFSFQLEVSNPRVSVKNSSSLTPLRVWRSMSSWRKLSTLPRVKPFAVPDIFFLAGVSSGITGPLSPTKASASRQTFVISSYLLAFARVRSPWLWPKVSRQMPVTRIKPIFAYTEHGVELNKKLSKPRCRYLVQYLLQSSRFRRRNASQQSHE